MNTNHRIRKPLGSVYWFPGRERWVAAISWQEDGRRRRRRVYCRTEDEALAALVELRREMFPEAHKPFVVDPETDCWNWQGRKDMKGYGLIGIGGKMLRAPRLYYELLVGPIPSRMTVDHLCCNTSCVNPKHFEIVTSAENTRRRFARS